MTNYNFGAAMTSQNNPTDGIFYSFSKKISVFFVCVWGLRYNMQREDGYIFSTSNTGYKTDTT